MFERSSEFIFERVYGRTGKKPDPNVIRKLRFLNPSGDIGALYREFCIRRIRLSMVTLIAGIIELSRFSSAFGRMSEMDGQLITAELDSPQTVYVKQAHTYLTPRFIVSLGSRCAVIPYANIFWTYKFTQRYNFIPIYSNIQVFTSDFRTLGIAEMSLFTPKKKQAEMTIFTAIQYYNPQVRFGYTAENSNYFNALRFQQVNSNYANNNVNNNAG